MPARDGKPPRREQILAAAADLFARAGFGGVSVGDIGSAVGISGPGLYRHFASKEAILAELLVGISEELLREGTARVSAAADPDEALAALVDWHVSFALDHPALITIQSRDLDRLAEPARRRVRRLQHDYVETWVDVVRRRSPALGAERARAAAHATFGLINSTPHSARLDRTQMRGLLTSMALASLRTLDGEVGAVAPDGRRLRG
ncbi:SACE_7040 family transcriptional regulator [Georgenia subflava]|uniref:TetR family transcriptional regulator n=1 Tax=Georgenia subflava TaxID=1622177 RepID=A0A6N7EGG5_9MICO|nr:TetR/AcrR family transcriptional regulator [Georgenia subflava]MPV35745.1 TetR family transcriptional regulator [Georgenia subflava]